MIIISHKSYDRRVGQTIVLCLKLNNFLPSLFIYSMLVSTDTTGLGATLRVFSVELSPSVAFPSSEQRVSEKVMALTGSSCKQFTSIKATLTKLNWQLTYTILSM